MLGKVEEAEKLFKDCLQKAEQEKVSNGKNFLEISFTHYSTSPIKMYWKLDSKTLHSLSFGEFFSFRRDKVSSSTIDAQSW
jgi:hypothetical protein